MGFEKVFLFGALGDRLDHTFGNLMLLKNYQGKVVIIDKDIQIVCINECYTLNLKGRAGSVISMFSIDDPSPKIITEGLKYNLLNKKLFFTTHGLSNELKEESASITLNGKGDVLVFVNKNINMQIIVK